MKFTPTPAKSNRTAKANFILTNFPEAIDEKNIRTNVKLVKRIVTAMGEAGLYSKNSVSQAGSDATVIRIIETIQSQRLAAKK